MLVAAVVDVKVDTRQVMAEMAVLVMLVVEEILGQMLLLIVVLAEVVVDILDRMAVMDRQVL
jgi:hypothetical protein